MSTAACLWDDRAPACTKRVGHADDFLLCLAPARMHCRSDAPTGPRAARLRQLSGTDGRRRQQGRGANQEGEKPHQRRAGAPPPGGTGTGGPSMRRAHISEPKRACRGPRIGLLGPPPAAARGAVLRHAIGRRAITLPPGRCLVISPSPRAASLWRRRLCTQLRRRALCIHAHAHARPTTRPRETACASWRVRRDTSHVSGHGIV
jgi:hypothetical protein